MTDMLFPLDIIPVEQTWRLVSRSALSSSPLTAFTQAVSRGGSFWSCDLAFTLQGEKRRRLDAFLARVADQIHTFALPDFAISNNQSGGVDTDNLFDKVSVAIGSWMVFSGTVTELTDSFGYFGLLKIDASASFTAIDREIASPKYTANGSYCFQFDLKYGSETRCSVGIGTSQGDTSLLATGALPEGRNVLFFTAPASGSLWFRIVGGDNQDKVVYVSHPILTPAAWINGASQTGRVLSVDGLAPFWSDSPAALKGGEMIEFSGELKRLTMDLDTGNDGAAGAGVAIIEPPVRASPADDSGVVFGGPACCRMRLANPGYERTDRPAGITDYQFTCVEAF